MIIVVTNLEKYFYDIHSLFKSFYKEEDVIVFCKGTKKEIEENLPNVNEGYDYSEAHMCVFIDMNFEDENIAITIYRKDFDLIKDEVSCSESLSSSSADDSNSPKNALKKLIYTNLKEITGKKLPWGTLTGIRPVKIAMHRLEKGDSDSDIEEYMDKTYLCSKEKTSLSIDISHREKRLLEGTTDGNGYSLYVNIPFCPTKCAYCSFMSSPIALWKDKVDDYIKCVQREIDTLAPLFKEKRLDSIYIGGGTPTTLSPTQMDILLSRIEDKFDISKIKEFTVESGRPDSIDIDKLNVMKSHKVSRISINPQTMNDKTLKLIGRNHSVAQIIETYNLARNVGFDHINMDIILGLPRENISDVEHTIGEIAKLKPDELTVHALAIKRASKLYDIAYEDGFNKLEISDMSDKMMEIASNGARDMGLKPYYLYRQKNIGGNLENTGFGSDDKMSLYNIITMEETESILALGSGSVSKMVYTGAEKGRIERFSNAKDVKVYMDNLDSEIEKAYTNFEQLLIKQD